MHSTKSNRDQDLDCLDDVVNYYILKVWMVRIIILTHIKACINEDPGVCGPLELKGLYRVHLNKIFIFHVDCVWSSLHAFVNKSWCSSCDVWDKRGSNESNTQNIFLRLEKNIILHYEIYCLHLSSKVGNEIILNKSHLKRIKNYLCNILSELL